MRQNGGNEWVVDGQLTAVSIEGVILATGRAPTASNRCISANRTYLANGDGRVNLTLRDVGNLLDLSFARRERLIAVGSHLFGIWFFNNAFRLFGRDAVGITEITFRGTGNIVRVLYVFF